ncbi:MAG: hypothetical protein QOI64_1078 [Solirubrobacteraceae bacterium]|jgi:hypothetical protein|nr:hypothetical protein [Solirubrobacteraceae bacterium]
MTANRRITRTAAALFTGAVLATLGLSPAVAGAENERIIGGGPAAGANWPSIVHLEMHFVEGGQGFTSSCGGTLVAPHWVVTAAHCTFGDNSTLVASNFTVVSGRPDLTDTSAGQSIGVTQIIRHPGYTNGGLRNDIALLRLATTAAAAPMELATQANASANVYTSPENTANTAGWGYTIPGNDASGSSVLKETYVPLRDPETECVPALAAVAPFDASIMVCAGAAQTNGTTTCHGDSGGPLVVFNGGRKVLWGIVNWGKPDCSGGISAFARVAAFRTFLQPVFDEIAPPAPPAVAPPPPETPVTPPPPPAVTIGPTQVVDISAPRLDRFVIPAVVRVRAGQPTRPITIKLRCNERATVRVYLLRRSGATYRQLNRSYEVKVAKGTSRMTLPRWMWRMTPGAYRLRFTVTDAAGNSRTYRAPISVRRG